MSSASLALETLNQRLHVVGHRGDIADARCPAHDDRRASLTFGLGDNGGVVLHCHAGCETQAILDAVGMSWSDISPEPHIVAVYNYCDEDGALLWQVERWEPKDFRCRPGLPPPAQRRLYHSEWLEKARIDKRTVYVVEGEKDADNLARVGEVAVCGVGGAGSWLPHYADQLAGLDVVVIADNDEPGKAHARAVARSLDGKAAGVHLAEPSYGKDISDQLEAGYGVATLVALPVDETLGIHRADRIREKEITWLWPGYLPTGKLAIVEGDPGDGKSVMTIDLAARFSTGSPLPDGVKAPSGPCDVVMISAEDDPEDTIRPRLRVAGADLTRVHLVTEGSVSGFPFDLGRDIAPLEHFIAENRVGLVVIDPLMAFMPQSVDAYKDHEVRRALHPLTRMAARTGCALLVVRHLTKGRTKAITAGGGSIAFIGAARVGFLVGPHPEDPEKRAFTAVKMNIAPLPRPLGYQVLADKINTTLPRVIWDSEPLDVTAQEVLDGEDPVDGRGARDDAREFLIELLSSNHSGLPWQDIVKAGRRDGHTEITLRRIRKSVAHIERNPLSPDGSRLKGTFWKLTTARTKDEKPTLTVVPEVTEVESWVPVTEEECRHEIDAGGNCRHGCGFNSDAERAREAQIPEFTAPTSGGCDVCGAEPAVSFGHPYQCRRCVNHNPMTYSKEDR